MQKNKKSKIPEFKNVQEEANFWDKYDISNFMDELEPVKAVFTPALEKKRTLSIRLAPSIKERIDKLAQIYDISSSSLIRMWIVEKLRKLS